MPRWKKKEGSLVDPQLYSVRRQFAVNGTYGETFGDFGVIIKLLNSGKDEKLIRQGWIQKLELDPFYDGKTQYECGKCGCKFTSMDAREAHGKKRHAKHTGPRVVDGMDSLTDEQKKQLVDDAGEYYTTPMDFHVPDPDDSAITAEERKMDAIAPIYWDKTEASRKGT